MHERMYTNSKEYTFVIGTLKSYVTVCMFREYRTRIGTLTCMNSADNKKELVLTVLSRSVRKAINQRAHIHIAET